MFERSLAQIDVYDWTTHVNHRDTAVLRYQFRELYNQLSSAQSSREGTPVMGFSTPKFNAAVASLKSLCGAHEELFKYGQFYVTGHTIDDLWEIAGDVTPADFPSVPAA